MDALKNIKDKTCENYIEDYKTYLLEKEGKRERTVDAYVSTIRRFLMSKFEIDSQDELKEIGLRSFSEEDVYKYISDKSENTKKSESARIRLFAKYLNGLGIHDTPNFNKLKIRIFQNDEYEYLKKDFIFRIAEDAKDSLDKACILICFEGLMKTESLAITEIWDYNKQTRVLSVYNNNPKRLRNKVVLSEETGVVLEEAINQTISFVADVNRNKEQRNLKNFREDKYLFQTPKSRGGSTRVISKMFNDTVKEYCRKNGLDDFQTELLTSLFTPTRVRESAKVYQIAKCKTLEIALSKFGAKESESWRRAYRNMYDMYPDEF